MELSAEILAALFAVAIVAGFIDSIAGGGGLIAVPALFAAGLPPAQVLGTSKLQGSFGSISASVTFLRRGEIKLRDMVLPIACTFCGAVAGALVVQALDPGFLRDVIPVLLILMALYILLARKAGDIESARKIGPVLFAVVVGFGLGFYDGFFGPGAGSFWALAYVGLQGYSLRRATAATKVVNATSNVASLAIFALGGAVVWSAGLTMGAGQWIGANLGARLVMRKGAALVRPLLVVMSLAITARLLWTNPEHPISQAAIWAYQAVSSSLSQ